MLIRKPFVCRNERMKAVFGCEFQQFAILYACPTHVADCVNVMTQDFGTQSVWYIFVKQNFHALIRVAVACA